MRIRISVGRRGLRCILAVFCAGTFIQQVRPQGESKPPAQSAGDPEFARLVREWTTRPEFHSPLVDHLPVAGSIPTPKEIIGHYIGEPKKLTAYADILKYYRALAEKSPRVRVQSIGNTDEGRECIVVYIGNDDSIRDLEKYRDYLAQLADPRRISESQAADILNLARPIYHIVGGLHSAETGPPEMLMELAYRLVVEETPLIKQIRKNVIVSLTPVADPDGRDRYVDWYNKYLVDLTDERNRLPGPPYWGKYVFHDNNRDIHFSQVSNLNILRWYLNWHPPIIHELHESVPFLYTFSGQAPQNPTLDPILYGELPWFSNFEMAQMTKYGMPGVWTHAFVDMWSPGYMGFMASNHNGMLRMYETFGNGGATTMKRTIEGGQGQPSQTTREWYRPLPPYKEVEWSMRNNTNYMETGVLSALELAASFPRVVLENFYRKSRNSIEDGKKSPPYAYIIPAGQRDATRVDLVVNLLRQQGIEVGALTSDLKLKEGTFPSGSFVVKRDQPYGRLAKILLEKQDFPDASLRTYDDTAWTLGLMTQTEIREIADKAVLEAPVEPIAQVIQRGKLIGSRNSRMLAIAHTGSNNLATLRWRLKDLKIDAAEKPFKAGSTELPAGTLLIGDSRTPDSAYDRIKKEVEALGLTAYALNENPAVPVHTVDLPRLAVYSTWGSTQEVGWVRHALDKFEIPYDLIYKERVKRGELRASYDVILIPSQGGSGKRIVFDLESRGKPLAYTRSEQFKNLGSYGESEDITGGMGLAGAMELQRFVETGGLLITLGSASFFPPEFGLTRSIDTARPSPQFYAPGPIVEAEILQTGSPIFYGYPQKTMPVRYANGPLLQVPERDREKQVLMRFPGTEKSVLSGLMRNPAEIRNRPAILDVPVGGGRVLIFATNPCYRWSNHGEFNLLFNSLLHFNDLDRR